MADDEPESTYTGDPAGRPIDAVRLELGKTVSLKYLTDSEISYNLTRAGNNVLLAASYSAETIAGMCADKADKSMGGSSVSWSQKAEAWRKKAQALMDRANSPVLTPQASHSRTGAPRRFSVGQHDFHGSGSWP
jgi:hypothetical protein